jgi:iron complex outermembrane receptor protein/vitamin B12 transporter
VSRHRVLAALAALLAASAALAEGPEELLVTGTRLAAPEADLSIATTVLDRDTIESRNDATVLDLLRAVPGLHINQPGAGGVPQVFIRGSEPNFTVFLLDGIKVNDLNNTRGGSFDLAALTPADIERVEIVRGPQSSIYGSDGLAGVINFISRRATDHWIAGAEIEGGAHDFRRGSLRTSGPLAELGQLALQASLRDDGEALPGSHYEVRSLSGQLRLGQSRDLSGGLYLRYADTERSSFPEQSGGPQFAELRTLDRARADDVSVGGDLDWRLGERVSLQALATWYSRSDRYVSPGVFPGDQVPPNGAANELERQNASVRLTLEPTAAVRATVGVDYQRESGSSDGYVDFGPDFRLPNSFALDRRLTGVFAEARWQASAPLLLQASLRHDEPEKLSGETTGKVGVLYALPYGLQLRVNWGTGYKLPSFFALGSPLVGEPTLKPERSRSVDAGIGWTAGGAVLELTAFHNRYEDLIDFDPETFRNVNRDVVTARGVEASGRWSWSPQWRLEAHLTQVQLEVQNSDRELLQRPRWRGGAAVRWEPAARWRAEFEWLYVGETLDNSIPTGLRRLDAWNRFDLSASWAATSRLRVSLAVDNVFAADYAEAVGFRAPGVRPRLGFRYDFLGGR